CNTNGTSDICDIGSGAFSDCNSNGVPDICEGDCNTNGTLDACELSGHDCNTNGVLDACDIAVGRSIDSNGNGIPYECEPGAGTNVNVRVAECGRMFFSPDTPWPGDLTDTVRVTDRLGTAVGSLLPTAVHRSPGPAAIDREGNFVVAQFNQSNVLVIRPNGT